MPKDNWSIASSDGKHYVITNDPSELPADATAAPLAGPPTDQQVKVLEDAGASVRVISKSSG